MKGVTKNIFPKENTRILINIRKYCVNVFFFLKLKFGVKVCKRNQIVRVCHLRQV